MAQILLGKEVTASKEAVLKINLDYEPREACYRGFEPTVRNVRCGTQNSR